MSQQCRSCGQWKDDAEFYRDSGTNSGLKHQCKVCYKARMKAAYWEDPDTHRLRKREYYLEKRNGRNR